jgi:hypothetical protein
MSATQDDDHPHRASDGLYYATYEAKRNANIRNNELRLCQLGLTNNPIRRLQHREVPASRVLRGIPQRTVPIRRSNRIHKAVIEYPHGIEDQRLEKTTLKKSKNVIRVRSAATTGAGKLSESNQRIPVKYPNWVEDMEVYLSKKENLSKQNLMSVMRQVRKLSSGTGITYHHWPENVTFGKGRYISLADDLEALYDEAVEFENTYGRDLGNGRWSSFSYKHFYLSLTDFNRMAPSTSNKKVGKFSVIFF